MPKSFSDRFNQKANAAGGGTDQACGHQPGAQDADQGRHLAVLAQQYAQSTQSAQPAHARQPALRASLHTSAHRAAEPAQCAALRYQDHAGRPSQRHQDQAPAHRRDRPGNMSLSGGNQGICLNKT